MRRIRYDVPIGRAAALRTQLLFPPAVEVRRVRHVLRRLRREAQISRIAKKWSSAADDVRSNASRSA
jgi:hypothetical protein